MDRGIVGEHLVKRYTLTSAAAAAATTGGTTTNGGFLPNIE
jgi:hypothetical protein